MRNRDMLHRLSGAAFLICLSASASRGGDFVPADLGTTSVETTVQAGPDLARQLVAFNQTATAMRLEGEDASRELTFYLSADQVTTAGLLRLSYTNAVSVMPDDAVLDVELNGKSLAAFPIRSPNGPATHDIPVAAKDLTVGWNQVRLRARQHHRIDCSVQATYELWTQVDPLVSGFLTSARPKDGDLASLLSVGRNGDGATEIRVVAGSDASQTPLRDSLPLVQTLALVLGREDLNVSIGDAGGSGPGIDLYLGDPSDVKLPQPARDALATAPRGLFVRQGENGRYMVTMRGSNKSELQSLLLAAVNGPLLPLIRSNKRAMTETRIDGEIPGRHTLSSIGYQTMPFAGRLFQTSFDVLMPSDFYPGDYATVDLNLDAATAPGLASGTQLLVRVNERAVASLVLYDPEGTTLKDKPLKLPLRAFHPGVNHVRVLAELPLASDLACDPTARDEARSRFLLLEETTVTIPPLARAGRLPDLAAFAGTSFPFKGSAAFDLYVDTATPAQLGSALTLLTRLAMSAGHPLPAELKIGRPDPRQPTNALIIGAGGEPLELASLPGHKGDRLPSSSTDPLTTASVTAGNGVSDSQALLDAFQIETRLEQDQLSLKSRVLDWAARASTTVNRWLDYKDIGREDVTIDPRDRLISLRQVASAESPAVWTLVNAADETMLQQGVAALTKPVIWTAIEGGEAVIRRSDLELVNRYPESYSFFPITDTSPANLRRLAAAWLSDNFIIYVGLVLALMGGFGWWVGYAVPRKGVRTVE
ncbi:cellulose biosynthesis cyclic di-GMP-binding regulatory protein BcsB [Rhizobium sp. AG855]|uniref:cellulose biosynthesis cyclic di-GMP-binding regulatory protein BcsB n=1 Tax=Rhizobium sp. AG855 TaxID=2183898 RepID=UPI000E75353E|nr:cellulose biosynthesis cyclic di-GMP-binding regulatory protein BcsB [Rhizobium sp. AG855]RKE79357.1 cellulose synthase subunit [Rhizobium sp. AG855]